MTTASEEILARYKETVTETDKFGRVITLGRIRPALEMAVLRMVNSNDRTNQVTYLAVASVRTIDGIVYPPARTLGELDAVMNKLDSEGLSAVGMAYAKLHGADEASKTDEAETDAKAELKNS